MTNRQIAEEIAERLLKNGFGEVGHRLAIKQNSGTIESDLGGWCRVAIIDQVEEILNLTKPQP